MAVEMTLEVKGMEAILRRVQGAADRARNLEPVLRPAAEELRTMIDDAFERSAPPQGGGWAPLKPATVQRKARTGRSPKPLIGPRGTMRRSVFASGSRGEIRFGVGAVAPYAPYQQFGTSVIPARPFLPVDESGQLVIRGKVAQFVARTKRKILDYIKGDR